MAVNPRPRKCKAPGCEERFTPRNSLQQACSPPCALALHRKNQEREERKRQAETRAHERRRRAEVREWRQRNKTMSELTKETQRAFNRMIRLRDAVAGTRCPTCQRSAAEVEAGRPRFGGHWDCGHFLTVGAHPELRFHEDNAHRQCKACNQPGGHRRVDYRTALVQRIGEERVRWLEGEHPPAKWTRDQLVSMKREFDRRAREYMRELEARTA